MFTNKDTDENYTDLKVGDVVVCTFSKNYHFIVGEEYEVISDSCGGYILITKNKNRFSLRPKQAGYYSTNLDNHWFYKKESVMDKEFKGGDWVFETLLNGEIRLEKLIQKGENVSTKYASYNKLGVNEQMPISKLVRATEEKRQALVILNGEDAVPKLELTGGEAVKYLLERQKYVLCWVSDISEDKAREGDVMGLIDSADTLLPEGSFYNGGDDWNYAVPVDMNEKEIVINLVEEK